MVNENKVNQFEVGKKYFGVFICDSEAKIIIEVVGRTDKTIKAIFEGKTKSFRVKAWIGCEFIKPLGNYSMAPVITCEKILN